MAVLKTGNIVILPTYRGGARISGMLDSLSSQTLASELYEVLVIENGSNDGTYWIVEAIRKRRPDLNIRYVNLAKPSVAEAMNYGINHADFDHLTIVDDDDHVSPSYLSSLWKNTVEGAITVGWVVDQKPEHLRNYNTYVNRGLYLSAGRRVPAWENPTSLAFNVAKVVATHIARQHAFDTKLVTGLDSVFWALLANDHNLDVKVIPIESDARYFRQLRSDSHSRPEQPDFHLGVTAKIRVIEKLLCMLVDDDNPMQFVAESVRDGQLDHIRRYLLANPEDHERAVAAIQHSSIAEHVNWNRLNRSRARDLVISWCFPPTADSSASVAARRVRARGQLVDVVSHTMRKARSDEACLSALIRPFVGSQFRISGSETIYAWRGLKPFLVKGWAHLGDITPEEWPYSKMYSRAMWPASHLLAAWVTLERPGTHWVAEFSDPLSIGTVGQRKGGAWPTDDPWAQRLVEEVQQRGFVMPADSNAMEWLETITYALADEVMFTNPVQRDLMIGRISDPTLQEAVKAKAVVDPHPVPIAQWYEGLPPVEFPGELINIGYFGTFYGNRGLNEILDVLLEPEFASRVRLQVFTSKHEQWAQEMTENGYGEVIDAHASLPYVDFLRQSKACDVLLVNDTEATQYLGVNPYLPSKVADYRGSGTPIWAILEEGSPMSSLDLSFTSPMNDQHAVRETLRQIVAQLSSAN